MIEPAKTYWDSSVFLCFLNRDEEERRKICEDILEHAQNGDLIIYTSVWSMVEVIRPRKTSLPDAKKLTSGEIEQIQGMFEWPWLKKIQLDERIAKKAVELSRLYGLHPSDSVHAASAILSEASMLQRWDRDFTKVAHLIEVEEPKYISTQPPLLEGIKKKRIGPHPDDFEPTAINVLKVATEAERTKAILSTTPIALTSGTAGETQLDPPAPKVDTAEKKAPKIEDPKTK